MNRIKDIALKANVSEGTVDRVIHNRGGVSEKTKQKILKIIDEIDYTINPVASILASKKKFTIATLLPSPGSVNDFWQTPKQGILDAAKEIQSLGFEIHHFEFDQFEPVSFKKAFDELLASEPSAVILAPILLKETSACVEQLDAKEIPYVTINAESEGLNNLCFIGQNSYDGGFLAGKLFNWVLPADTEILIVKIRRDIQNNTPINNRIKGFNDYFTTSSKNITTQEIVIDMDTLHKKEMVNNLLDEYLNKHPTVKGVFIPSSKAHFIAKSIIDINRQDIEIGGFDTTPDNITYLKNDTIDFLISQKPHQQGYQAVKLLFNYLIGKKEPQKNYFLPIEVILKENVAYL